MHIAARRDYLQAYWTQAPLALAIVRASECEKLSRLTFDQPMLDLGCGDGLLGQILFGRGVDVGLDLSRKALQDASRRRVYDLLMLGDASHLPFQDGTVATVFTNCVLEHLVDLHGGLHEIARVLRAGGRLILTVPTDSTQHYLAGAIFFRAVRLRSVAQRYENWYNRVFTQRNLFSPEQWRTLLAECGLSVEMHIPYGSVQVVACHDLLAPLCLPHLMLKRLTGRYVLWPAWRRRVAPLVAGIVRRVLLRQSAKRAGEPEECALLLVAGKAISV